MTGCYGAWFRASVVAVWWDRPQCGLLQPAARAIRGLRAMCEGAYRSRDFMPGGNRSE